MTRASLDSAAHRTRSLARASLRAIGLERLAAAPGAATGDQGLGLADRRVLCVQMEEWRDDAALRASALGEDGHGSGHSGGGCGGATHAAVASPGSGPPPPPPPSRARAVRRTLVLAYGAVGVVFGDVLTSPLYTLSAVFAARPPTAEEVQGSISIIFWTLTCILVLKVCGVWERGREGRGAEGTRAMRRR